MWIIQFWDFIKNSPQILDALLYYVCLFIGLASFIYFVISEDKRGAMFCVKMVVIYFAIQVLKGVIL